MSTTDDKTPVDLVITPVTLARAGTLACPSPPCRAAIRDRSGRDLGYVCNLTRGHLGRHAQVYQEPGAVPSALVDDAE